MQIKELGIKNLSTVMLGLRLLGGSNFELKILVNGSTVKLNILSTKTIFELK